MSSNEVSHPEVRLITARSFLLCAKASNMDGWQRLRFRGHTTHMRRLRDIDIWHQQNVRIIDTSLPICSTFMEHLQNWGIWGNPTLSICGCHTCTEPLDPPYFLANLLYAALHITHESIFRCIVYSTKKRWWMITVSFPALICRDRLKGGL